ncbi:hypothetical protein Scep_023252 [Stephania cephalantha]|uniref:Uncharacterized protein n=1 Tax=Stephania cephalantha TaxID=152367 RepID=A0AAP0HW55_9MAGN
MGLEIPKEFYPITPIRTNPGNSSRTVLVVLAKAHDDNHQSDDLALMKSSGDEAVVLDDEECRTPTSEEHLLKTPLVCPPAPKKPLRKPAKRKRETLLESPIDDIDDLESIFVLLGGSNGPQSKKIKAARAFGSDRVHRQS